MEPYSGNLVSEAESNRDNKENPQPVESPVKVALKSFSHTCPIDQSPKGKPIEGKVLPRSGGWDVDPIAWRWLRSNLGR